MPLAVLFSLGGGIWSDAELQIFWSGNLTSLILIYLAFWKNEFTGRQHFGINAASLQAKKEWKEGWPAGNH